MVRITMDTPPTARRGRPLSGGREQILAATLELLRERGASRTTTRDVAARAGVSEGSVFYHFKDRAGLLLAVFAQVHQPLGQLGATGLPVDDLPAALDRFTAALETFLADSLIVLYAAHADVDLREPVHRFLAEHDLGPHRGVDLLGAYLRSAQAHGTIRPGIDVQTVAFALIGTCQMRVGQHILIGSDRGLPSRAEVVQTYLALLRP